MKTWLLIGVLVVATVVLLWLQSPRTEEGFQTLTNDSIKTQRQQMQWEGEQRYNDLALAQDPRNVLPADKVDAALQNAIPVPTTKSRSLTTLIGDIFFKGLDDGSNKIGSDFEKTGILQQKIDRCEAIKKIDCTLLTQADYAECGFCHKDGKDSRGMPHRGGMYISSDDMIRANEKSTLEGTKAVYKPTVGSCDPAYFTTIGEDCGFVEGSIMCQKTGAPTTGNQCAIAHGSNPGTGGLVFVGDKTAYLNPDLQALNLKTDVPMLYVSHPGGHGTLVNVNGVEQVVSMVIKTDSGLTIPWPMSTDEASPLWDPQVIPMPGLVEGQNITISISGIPRVWCAWVGNFNGNRSYPINIGVQAVTPFDGIVETGDINSSNVKKSFSLVGMDDTWNKIKNMKDNAIYPPKTTMWYIRRDEAMAPMVVSAKMMLNDTDPNPIDMTVFVKTAQGQGNDFTATGPGATPQHLMYIQFDNMIKPAKILNGTRMSGTMGPAPNKVVFGVIHAATVSDTPFPTLNGMYPTGPFSYTPIGATLMGANPCYDQSGNNFTPSTGCLTALFVGAGGTPDGNLYPNKVDASGNIPLVSRVAQSVGKKTSDITLDDVTTFINNGTNIAMYGVDMNAKSVPFADYKQALEDFFGLDPPNPCFRQSSPFTATCLDYLYRTSNTTAYDNLNVDMATLPYSRCNANGAVAPIDASGNIRQTMVDNVNTNLKTGPQIRAFYDGIFQVGADANADYATRSTAIKNCIGIDMPTDSEIQSDQTNCPAPTPMDPFCFAPGTFISAGMTDEMKRAVMTAAASVGITDTSVPACMYNNLNDIVCAGTSDGQLTMFPGEAGCKAWAQNPSLLPNVNTWIPIQNIPQLAPLTLGMVSKFNDMT